MAYTNSDQLKWSIDNLKKYRLFTENKLKQFILKEFNQCSSILRKIMLEGEIYHLLSRDVFQKIFASVVQSWSGLH